MYSIGVDIGGSHITSCMYEHTNKRIDRKSLVYRKINTQSSKEEIIDGWVSAITKSIEICNRPIAGIGIAMPGPFDYFNGVSLISGVNKLESLYKVDIRQELATKLGMEASRIRFINDASAFSIAEASVGKASKYDRVVAITLGTGLGSSFVYKGLPKIEADNVPDGGFLYNKYHQEKLADDIFSTRGILKRYREISGKTVKNVRELCERAPGDNEVVEVFSWFGKELGHFLAPYLSDFDAEVLVIGGNISKASSFFLPEMKEQLPQTEIFISELGEEAAIIGGALLLDDHFYNSLIPTLKSM